MEALQIIRALTRETYGGKHHPAVRMWLAYEVALASYGLAISAEWVARGHADTCAATMAVDVAAAGLPAARPQLDLSAPSQLPPWLGDERLHRSHQASLVRKDPSFYAARFPDTDLDLPYFWPTHEGQGA